MDFVGDAFQPRYYGHSLPPSLFPSLPFFPSIPPGFVPTDSPSLPPSPPPFFPPSLPQFLRSPNEEVIPHNYHDNSDNEEAEERKEDG